MATPVLMPRQGQSVESCILVKWLVKAGDAVAAGQPVAEIETDKATFQVEAPAAGTVLALFFDEGADVPVLTHIAAVGAPGEDVAGLRPEGGPGAGVGDQESGAEGDRVQGSGFREDAGTRSAAISEPEPRTLNPEPFSGASPRARSLAAARGVDVSRVAGTGPGGRVLERDVKAAAAGHASPAAREAAAAGRGILPAQGRGPGGMVLAGDLVPPTAAAATPSAGTGTPAGATAVPVRGIRKIIAERMRKSLGGTAQLTLNLSFRATALLAFREKAKASAAAGGPPVPTINDLIVFALARTLTKHPALNAHFLGDRILQFAHVHLGIAVDTPRGLMVPVLRDADTKSLAEISQAIKPLAVACQEGSVSPDLLQGGTFTLTNLGALGIDHFTPVLNAPEVGILGVGGLGLKPVRDPSGEVTFADAITLSLTMDHQAVDGAPAARFLKDLCAALESIDQIVSN